METIVQKEIIQNARKILDSISEYSSSYNQQRNLALEYFQKNGIPTKKNEDWLYTNIGKNLAPRLCYTNKEISLNENFIIDPNAVIIVNNGIIDKQSCKLPNGISFTAPLITNEFHDVFDALNFAVATEAATIIIKKEFSKENIITILHTCDENSLNKQSSPRIQINLEENTEATIVEFFTSTQNQLYQYTTNAHTGFNLSSGSKLKHIKINFESKNSTHIGLTKAIVARDACFETYLFDFGNLVARNNIEVHLNAEGANCQVHGLFNLTRSEHSDVFTKIFHHSPHTQSDQLFKGILNQTSHGAFTGKIVIDHGAYGSNSSQLNKNLLLSKKAHIDTRPQLLVSADDVKCSHGATVGELSNEEEFYLTSRGISKLKARKMLAMGFAHEVMLKMNNKRLFDFVNNFLIQSEFDI